MIIIDNREHIEDCKYERRTLDLGDFHLMKDDKVIFIVERKTVPDYLASIKDGRLHEQCYRLVETRDRGVGVGYIIEGKIEGDSHISTDTLVTSIFNKVINHKIPVFFSADIGSTLMIVERLNVSVEKYEGIVKDYLGCVKSSKSTVDNSLERMLMTIPGISIKIATKIKGRYSSIKELVEAFTNGTYTKIDGVGKQSEEKIRSFLGF